VVGAADSATSGVRTAGTQERGVIVDFFVLCFAVGAGLSWFCFGWLYWEACRKDNKRTRELNLDQARTQRQLGYLK
jgi:hypothetical protein